MKCSIPSRRRPGFALLMRYFAIALLGLAICGCGNGRAGTIKLDPSHVFLSTGGRQDFKVIVEQCPDTSISWSVDEGSEGGAITDSGQYTAPDTAGTYHITATCRNETNIYGNATIDVN